jgi:hypothetical protein
MREISNLDLKIQLTNEYLRTGGIEKIHDVGILQDLIDTKFDINGKAIPDSITPRLNAFMLAILGSQMQPPFHTEDHIAEYGSFVQKSLFFDQTEITTKGQIDELIVKYKDSKTHLFRGQSEAKWRLYSTLQRWWIWDKMEKSDKKFLEVLKNMILAGGNDYKKEINEILKKIDVDTINDVSILGFLQHHGCPTPLLDWTYDFKTSLFFSIDGINTKQSPKEIDNYLSVYFIKEEHFDNGSMRKILDENLQTIGEELKLGLIAQIAKDENQQKEMEKHFKERSFFDNSRIQGSGLINHMTKIEHMINFPISYFSDNDKGSGIAFSITNSENIKKQNGVFVWNSDYAKPLEVVGNEQYCEAKSQSEPDDYRFCECYNISKELVPYIIEKLEEYNINKDTIYPDKDIDTRRIYDENKKAST